MKAVAISLAAALALAAGAGGAAAGAGGLVIPDYARVANPIVEGPSWEVVQEDVDGEGPFLDGEALMSLDAPVQAFDSGAVPFAVRQRPGTGVRIARLTVVVDENPAPVAAEFEFGPLMGDVSLESRVRYDVYSNLRAIAQTEDGRRFMVGRFVQAAGGCSAAVSRDPAVALATMGEMRLKRFDVANGDAPRMSGAVREAQVMIRHPNFTGLQVREGTLDRIDPRFVELVEVFLGEDLLFRMTGGFSISENPSFRFRYRDNGADTMTVRAVDTDGAEFKHVFRLAPGA